MDWLRFFRNESKNSASLAKERLQLVVAHQRNGRSNGLAFLPRMQEELLGVIRKYVTVGDEAIRVNVEREGGLEVLELNITLPEGRA
ncbi:MAG TPA: cell division topological specificity factor MinE [Candidatus Binatia bacterium]|nr:cell division topological specificity factor MinE [Candidatus Binatia bacterium]